MNKHAIWAIAAALGVSIGTLVGGLLPPTGTAAIAVSHAWVRDSAPGQTTAAVYVTIANRTPRSDALVGAYVPTKIARIAELHTTMAMSARGATSEMSSEELTMTRVTSIDLPAHQTSRLRPGSSHIMLVGMVHPLRVGDSFPVTLEFAHIPDQTVTVAVEAT